MFKRLLEIFLGLDKGFFDAQGELGWHFDPHWPGPLIGEAGRWQTYLLGTAAIVLLVILSRRTATRQLHRVRLGLAAGSAVVAALLVAASLGIHWWTIALVVGVGTCVIVFFTTRREVALMALGRVALFSLLLMVISGARSWNLTLGIGGGLLVIYVYRRDGRSTSPRIILGTLRGALIAFVLILLNNPILTRTNTVTEPSVVAVLVDDSLSMSVRDVNPGPAASGDTRLEAAIKLFTDEDQALIRKLARVHSLRFYTFDRTARQLGAVTGADEHKKPENQPEASADRGLIEALQKLPPEGTSTQVIPSIMTVLDDLQGQRLAGVVILTDGRDTPTAPLAEAYKALANYGVKVYPIALGSDKIPQNIELVSVSAQESAFKDDIVNIKATVRATGYEPGHAVMLRLTDKRTNRPLIGPDGNPVTRMIHAQDSHPIEEELLFKPDQIGPLDVKVEAVRQPGELNEKDNDSTVQISVLDARIVVLYVEGYPRWEYRYIKNEMIRDKTVDISCVLTSADPTFPQEHTSIEQLQQRGEGNKFSYFPYHQFPATMEQLMECDVVLFGDVDPRQFADSQLQMVADFVNKKGGGFGMVAGPQWSPVAYRNTPIEALLPVNVLKTDGGWPTENITEGFRPVVTKEGAASSIFRFFTDRPKNELFLKEQMQPLFWYARGITAKAGVGQVFAEHPTDLAPDGRSKAPLLVVGRYGMGRTLFSAYDDSWRWRFYTGESIFDTYWVQQLRYLARSKKLGQREFTFTPDRNVYQLGDQVHIALRVLNPALLQQLPPEIIVQVKDEKGQTVRAEKLRKEAGQADYYTASFGADRAGRYVLSLPPIINDVNKYDFPLDIIVPRMELAEPQVDRTLLSRVAGETGGQEVKLEEARARLPDLIQSAARITPRIFSRPLWDKPAAMVIFVLLLTLEWVLRKVYGMV